MDTSARTLAVTGLLAMGGCAPTYAPPVRTPEFGAPGRTAEGDVAIGGSMVGTGYVPTPQFGGPMLAYGIRDAWSVEGGGDFGEAWRMGWAGARFTHAPRRYAKNYLALDVNAAGGGGLGGELRGNGEDGDGRSAFERVAGGGLLGAGVAGHFSFFSVFGRARGQVTKATGVPTTMWWNAGLGLQFRLWKSLDLYVQTGPAGYSNAVEDEWSFVSEAGIAVRIPTRRWGYR